MPEYTARNFSKRLSTVWYKIQRTTTASFRCRKSMNDKNDIKYSLTNLCEIFQNGAVELVSVMFNLPAVITQPWDVTEISDARYDYIFRQISENKQFKANVIIGASYTAIETILGSNISLDEARDAFGEFANCYNAILMEQPSFVEEFGYLTQRVPEDSTVLACFPLAWGIQGNLLIGQDSLFLRFSIEKNRFGEDLLAFLDA